SKTSDFLKGQNSTGRMKKTTNITEQDESLFRETIGSQYLVLNKRYDILLCSTPLWEKADLGKAPDTLEDVFPSLSHRLIVKAHVGEAFEKHRPIELCEECLLPGNENHPYSASFIP